MVTTVVSWPPVFQPAKVFLDTAQQRMNGDMEYPG
jgi:hypothetical protein